MSSVFYTQLLTKQSKGIKIQKKNIFFFTKSNTYNLFVNNVCIKFSTNKFPYKTGVDSPGLFVCQRS